jgi:hypothetical protein
MFKMLFFMVFWKGKFIRDNLLVLLMLCTQIIFVAWLRLFMFSSRLLAHGMLALALHCALMALCSLRPTLLYFFFSILR